MDTFTPRHYSLERLDWRWAGPNHASAQVMLYSACWDAEDTAVNPDPFGLPFSPGGPGRYALVSYMRNERTGHVTARVDYDPAI